jgi:hypothetical protein
MTHDGAEVHFRKRDRQAVLKRSYENANVAFWQWLSPVRRFGVTLGDTQTTKTALSLTYEQNQRLLHARQII